LNPQQLLRDTIRLGQELSKTADDVGQDALGLSLDEEIQLGKDVHRHVIREHKVRNATAATKRLRELAKPLLPRVERAGISYTFTVLASPEINAFSHVGGYVYVNQGLLDFAKSAAELQFVIAHEIAHVDLGHCRRGLTYTVRAGELTGGRGADLVQQAYHLIALGYSEDQEFAADEWAFRHMLKIGRTNDEALAMPRHFASRFGITAERQQSADKNRPDTVIADEIETHLRSHPPATERVRRLEELAATEGEGK
jgi:predicted Zn-dependent protease